MHGHMARRLATRHLDEASALESFQADVDNFYLLFAGACVFLMQAGFAMLCAGSVRAKNVKNIMLKNLLDACGGAIGFYTLGYAIAYGDPKSTVDRFVGGTTYWGGDGLDTVAGTDTDYMGWFFQFAFAATAATIVAGTVAERCKMSAYVCYSLFLTAFVYPVVVHAVWSSAGFLSSFNDVEGGGKLIEEHGAGVIDFAGSGVVHMTGGVTALIAAAILGARKGRFHDADGNPLPEPHTFPPHSVSLQVLGTFILWFGWYGFNPGSTLGINGYGDTAALCAITTTLSAACGCVSGLFINFLTTLIFDGEGVYDLTMAMNGCLSGLVGITSGCCVMQPWAACITGFVSGCIYIASSNLLVMLKIDDAVDAIPVHGFNGMWGVLSVGLLADPDLVATNYGFVDRGGVFYGSTGYVLVNQILCVLFILGWVSVTMVPFFFVLKALNMLRVDPLEEEVGLDISHHGGAAYDMTGPKKEDVEELIAQRSTKHNVEPAPEEVEA